MSSPLAHGVAFGPTLFGIPQWLLALLVVGVEVHACCFCFVFLVRESSSTTTLLQVVLLLLYCCTIDTINTVVLLITIHQYTHDNSPRMIVNVDHAFALFLYHRDFFATRRNTNTPHCLVLARKPQLSLPSSSAVACLVATRQT